MGNNHLTSPYDNHLPNIRSPFTRSNEQQRPHTWSVAPQTRLPSFSNFLFNTSHRAMEVDQPTEVRKQTSKTVKKPDGKERNAPAIAPVQGTNMMSSKGTERNEGPSSGKVEESLNVRTINVIQGSMTTPIAEVEAARPTGSSSTDTMLYASTPSSPNGDLIMVDSLIHDITEFQRSKEVEEYSTPPLFSVSDHCSNSSFEVKEAQDREKNTKDKMKDTIKKALERALSLRNRSSCDGSIPVLDASHDTTTKNAHKPCTTSSQTPAQSAEGGRSSLPKGIPRIHRFTEANRNAVQTGQTARTTALHRGAAIGNNASPCCSTKGLKLPVSPRDPILAASLNVMALEHAKTSNASTALPSVFKKTTGKRNRETDHFPNGQDHQSTHTAERSEVSSDRKLCSFSSVPASPGSGGGGPDRPKDSVLGAREMQNGSISPPKSFNGQFVENPTGRRASPVIVTDQKCRNDLDFLASVVLSQEFTEHRDKAKTTNLGLRNGSAPVSNQRETIHQHFESVQGPVSQPLSVGRHFASNLNASHISPVALTEHVAPPENQEIGPFNQSIQPRSVCGSKSIMATLPTAENTAYAGQNCQIPQQDQGEQEPKSEASFIDHECPATRVQENQVQAASQIKVIQMTEESTPFIEDEVTAAENQALSRDIRLENISPVRQTSSSRAPNSFGRENSMAENVNEAKPALKCFNSSQKTFPPNQAVEDGLLRKKNTLSHGEDETTPDPPRPLKRPSPRPSASSRTYEPSSKAPKPSVRRRLYQEMDEVAPAPLPSQNISPPRSHPYSLQAGSSKEGKRPVQNTMYEDVSEITPAPPRPQRSGAYQAGSSSQRHVLTYGTGSSAQGASRGETARDASDRAQATTTLPYTFSCDCCGAMFNRRFNLNKHIRNVHHNIRKFKCSMCEERFLQKSHRAAHLLAVHHKIRPFVCHLCAKNFSWLGVLRKHLQAIHKVPVQTTKRAKRTRNTQASKSTSPPDQTRDIGNAPPPSEVSLLPTPPSNKKRQTK